MKLTIERTNFLRSLSHVQSVVERRTTIPILGNVLLQASGQKLGMTATDMDLAIDEKTAAQVAQPGSVTAPAHMLYDIVRKLPEGAEIELSQAGQTDQLTLRAGRSRFSLACLPPADFPAMSGGDQPHRLRLGADQLRLLIDRTRFAISTEETRYYLNGIYFHAAETGKTKVLRAVATDGHRLARVEIPLPEGAGQMPGVIIPRKTVNELRKLIDETGEAVNISLSDTKIAFAFDDAVLTSKLIDGTFPDYARVIPTGNDKALDVDCKSFGEAVDRVATISTERSRAIKLTLNKKTLTLSATSPESGTASEEIEVGYDGEPIEIGFNSRYLLDITQQISGKQARFSMADGASPTIIQDVDDSGSLYVLMPMRV